MNRFLCAVFALVLVLFSSSTASAIVIDVYGSFDSWSAAVDGTYQTESFNTVDRYQPVVGLNDAGLIDIRVNENAVGNYLYGGPGGYFMGNSRSQLGYTQDIVFDAPINGFWGHWGFTLDSDRLTVTIGGTTLNFADYISSNATNEFIGFVFDTPVTEFRISDEDFGTGSNEAYNLYEISFSTAATSVPLPGALFFLGTGMAALAGFRRKIKTA